MNNVNAFFRSKSLTNLSFSVKVVISQIIVILLANLIFVFVMSGSSAINVGTEPEFCLLPLQSSILESLRQVFKLKHRLIGDQDLLWGTVFLPKTN